MLIKIVDNAFNVIKEGQHEEAINIKYKKIDLVYYVMASESILYSQVDFNLLDYTKCINPYKECSENGLKLYFVNNAEVLEDIKEFTVKLEFAKPLAQMQKINVNIKRLEDVFPKRV
jgi:hypothetical protein